MAHMETTDLLGILDLVLGITKDKAFEDALRSVQAAQREYLEAEVRERRTKTKAIIKEIAHLDAATLKLKHEYERIQPMLTVEAGQSQILCKVHIG